MRQLSRAFYINKVLLQHGLDEWLPTDKLPWYAKAGRCTLFWLRNQHPTLSLAERSRLALQQLGPVFIKFGQMLSTRRDLLSPDLAAELARLQDQVPAFDGTLAEHLICRSLGIDSLDVLFSEFETQPMAAASIAQVHGAVLRENQQPVVVKVLRPDIRQQIESDLALLASLASLAQRLLSDGKRLRPVEVVEEYRKTILDELDLKREAANGQQLKNNFTDSPLLYVPHIYAELCREQVLVMERIDGVMVSDIAGLQAQGTDFKKLAERGVQVFFTQVFRDSFFHADMHPGNIFVSRVNPQEPQYIALDFGIVGVLNASDKRYLAENFIAFFNRDYRKVAQLHVDSGWVPANVNVDDFELAIREVCEPIFAKPLAEISFGQVLVQLFHTARRFNMIVQPQLVLLQKTLLYIEGLGRQLYPQLDLWQTAKPFLENWMQEQISVKASVRKVQQNLPFWLEKLPDMPDLLHDSLQQIKQLPYQQQQQFLQQQAEAARQASKQRWTGVGATLLLVACLFPLQQISSEWSLAVALLGGVAWLRAWQR